MIELLENESLLLCLSAENTHSSVFHFDFSASENIQSSEECNF